jgi:myo-inositol-1(or 4)-monophosphatase
MDRRFATEIRAAIRARVDFILTAPGAPAPGATEKAPHDLVTEIDRRLGTDLAKTLTTLLPGSSATTEDGTGIQGADRYRWIIDPIDGTANLVMGNTHYCTSVALEEKGTLCAAFVYHPAASRVYWSIGQGKAFADDTPIHPSARRELGSAYVVFGFSANLTNIERYHREWTPAFEESRKAIGLLAPALNICTVASGAVDAFIDFGCSSEGQSAAGLILHNAGGTVANYDGTAWDHRTIGIYASNGRVKPTELLNLRAIPAGWL